MVFLKDQADILSQEPGVPFLKIHPVEGYASAVRLVELVQQIDYRGLPGSAQTHEGGDLPAIHFQGDVVESLRPVRIGEVHALHLEVADHLFRTVSSGRFHLLVSVHDVEITLSVDNRVVEVVEDPLQLADRGGDIGEEHDVVHDLSDRHSGISRQN